MALSNFFWDSNKPVNHLLIADIPQALRWLNFNTQTVLGNEHSTFTTTDNVGCIHKPGSAVIFYDDYMGDPTTNQTTRPNGSTALDGDDVGRLLWDTYDGTMYIWQLVDGEVDEWEWARTTLPRVSAGEMTLRSQYTISGTDYDVDVQMTSKGKLYMASEMRFTGDASINSGTADGSDDDSLSLLGGGASGETRGGRVTVYGNDHASKPGQVVLNPGYSDGTPTDAVIDCTDHLISNVKDPATAQDAATKAYVDTATTVQQFTGSSNISNTTGAWADMTNMTTGTITTVGTKLLCRFNAVCRTGNNGSIQFRFDVDGSPYHVVGMESQFGHRGLTSTIFMEYLVTGLTAGSHVIKVQWYDVADTAYQDGTTYPRVLQVQDLA